MVIKEGEPVVGPALYIELPPLKPKLGDRDHIEYPKGEFRYNHTRVKIAVQSGVGALALQQVGEDEETGRVSRDVVKHFQCLRIEKSSGHFEIPANHWYFISNLGHTPLKLEIDSPSDFPPDELDSIKMTRPQVAFILVREDNNPVLLPTCRVGRVQRVSTEIPYAKKAR